MNRIIFCNYVVLFSLVLILLLVYTEIGTASTSKTFNYSLNDVEFDTLDGFDYIKMGGVSYLDSLGKPFLPYFVYKFIIPRNMDVSSISVLSSNDSIITGTYEPYPAQPPIPTIIPSPDIDFEDPDSATYISSNYYPGVQAECIYTGFFDGANKIATIAVYPLHFQGSNDRLKLITSLSISLNFTSSTDTGITAAIRTEWGIKMYEEILKSMIVNPEDIPTYGYTPTENNDPYQYTDDLYWYPYTIITTDALDDYFDDLVEWLRMRGIYAGTVVVDDITDFFSSGDIIGTNPIPDEAGSIRQYLHNGWGDNGLIYALLAGIDDDDYLREAYVACPYPTIDWEELPTDVYFSDMQGDWNYDNDEYFGEKNGDFVDFEPDIFIGRINVNSGQTISWWYDKLLAYETLPGSRDHLFDVAWTESDFMQYLEIHQLTTLTDWWINSDMEYTLLDEEPEYNSPRNEMTEPTAQQVINLINSGCGWINHYNHGGTKGISIATEYDAGTTLQLIVSMDHYIEQGKSLSYESITNGDSEYPIMYTVSCHGGDFADPGNDTTLAEGFTSHNSQGGPAAIANTGYCLTITSPSQHGYFYKHILDYGNGDDVHIGPAQALSRTYLNLGSDDPYYVAMGNTLFGSPEMIPWVETPQEYTTITHPLYLPLGGNDNYTVDTDAPRSLICIYQENNGFYEFALADAGGEATFDIDLTSSSRIWLTVNRFDYIPYQWSMLPGFPAPPQGIEVSLDGNNHPVISWNDNTEPDFEGYNIYKRVWIQGTQSSYILQNTEELYELTTWTDEEFAVNHQGGATAYYYITAVDDDNDESGPSETVSVPGYEEESIGMTSEALYILNNYNGIIVYPNPFNEQISLKFIVKSSGNTNLSIYNIVGQKIVELFDGIANANQVNHFIFDASNFSSGIYFCKLKTCSSTEYRKIIYLK